MRTLQHLIKEESSRENTTGNSLKMHRLAFQKSSPRSGRLDVSSRRYGRGSHYVSYAYVHQEGLTADIRVESERKLKALETDLVAAEKANKERTLATRYHKVKFFGACSGPRTSWHIYDQALDRQKLLRKIKQTKSRLKEDGVSSKVRRSLEAELFELRVDLNYVLVRLSNSCVMCWRCY